MHPWFRRFLSRTRGLVAAQNWFPSHWGFVIQKENMASISAPTVLAEKLVTPRNSKRAKAVEGLVEIAKTEGPGAKLPGVRELCEILDVSTATLDRAMKEAELRGAIVCEHGRGIFATATVNKRKIAFILGANVSLSHPSDFWMLLFDAALHHAATLGYELRFYINENDPHVQALTHGDLLRDLKNHRLDGILLASPRSSDDIKWTQKWKLPTVVTSSNKAAKHRVGTDRKAAIQKAVKQLATLGCKRVGLLGVNKPEESDFYIETLAACGLDYNRAHHWEYSWFAPLVPHKDNWEKFAYNLVKMTFPKDPPDGLFVTDDVMGRGVLMALLRLGIHPRRDIHLMISANKGSSVLLPYEDDLILVENDPSAMAAAALDKLAEELNSGTVKEPDSWIAPRIRRGKAYGARQK